MRIGWRDSIGTNAIPAQFGGLNLGANWSNYEFTTWDGHTRVEDLFWEQQLGPNFSFRIGNMIPTAVYNFSRFKDARVSFTASPFAFHDMIPQPTFGLGASFRWTPAPRTDPGVYVVGTINDMNGEPAANGFDWSTVEEGQFFYGLEVGKRWRRENGEFDHLHVNLFYADERSTRNPDVAPNAAGWGFRVYGEKQMGRIVGFGGYTYNTAEGGGISSTLHQHVATAGVAYLNPLQIRGEIAVGAMYARPIKDIIPGLAQRDQYGFETYWRLQVTPNLSATPGVQVVYDPSFNPTVDTIIIPSFKFRVVF
ncbi:carbohydrate porin [Meridianimarinicoccus sp. RP-17]|uniref:carbohydrate porin n=1 Tax=Meridianimarinicoccus zhengii TaxID=2056810 RepID=UPI000DAC6609|nr:carbohydrate porin [Phycocomes zhengii]